MTVPEGPTAAEAGHEPAATAEGTGTAVAIAVELRGASCHYRTPAGVVRAVDDIDLQVRTGECVAVMGPSGSGKSTLLALLGGLEQASSGTVEVLGTDWSTLSSEGRARFRRQNVGFVFQDLGLLPFLTAAENVAFGAGLSGASTTLDPREVLEHLGLTTQLDRLPDQLSGGERGRVAIGRGLAHKPRLVLGDEPTGSLDAEASDLTITYFLQAVRGLGSTAVVVTHDPDVAARFDRTVLLRDGHVVGGPPASTPAATPGPTASPPGPTPGPPPASTPGPPAGTAAASTLDSTPAPTPAPPPAPTPASTPESHPADGSEAGSTDGSGSV